MLKKRNTIIGLAILAIASLAVFAYKYTQNNSATADATASAPAPTVKQSGDWKIICNKIADNKEKCALKQTVTITQENKQVPVATYEFAYEGKQLKLVEILPQGVLLQPGTSVIAGDKVVANAKFTICQNNMCIAAAIVSNEDLETILSKEAVAVGMFNLEAKQFNLHMSTKGLKEGLEAIK